jgi:hypothetical protein
MRRKRTPIALVLMLALLALVALQAGSGAITEWQTKASANSRGLSTSWNTEAAALVDVRNPYAIRAGFRTNKDVSRRVSYDYYIDCERKREREGSGTTTTARDGSWKNVTIQRASTELGRVCNVDVYAEVVDGAQLRMRVQAKHP